MPPGIQEMEDTDNPLHIHCGLRCRTAWALLSSMLPMGGNPKGGSARDWAGGTAPKGSTVIAGGEKSKPIRTKNP